MWERNETETTELLINYGQKYKQKAGKSAEEKKSGVPCLLVSLLADKWRKTKRKDFRVEI